MAAEKRYELRVDGQILGNLTEADITEIFRSGRMGPSTPCRISGDTEWQNLNEYFPLLKYGIYAWEAPSLEKQLPDRSAETRPAYAARWKIGAICFAAGLLCAGAVPMWSKKTPTPQLPPSHGTLPHSKVTAAKQGVTVPVRSTPVVTHATFSSHPRAEGPSRVSTRITRETVQNTIPAARPPVSKPVVKPEEVTIPLDQWTSVHSAHGSFSVKIHDHGPATISVWINSGYSRRIEKEKGFETDGTNIVQIHALPGAKVYYVDRIGVSIGYCVLKIIPNS